MRKKVKKVKRKPLIKYYLYLYLSCLVVVMLTYSVASFISSSQLPCANSISCKNGYDEIAENGRAGIFAGKPIEPPDVEYEAEKNNNAVLGISEEVNLKHIYVDLKNQKLYAIENDREYMQTYISTGRWGKTPPGNYNVYTKLRSTRMSGGSGNDFYDLPNVPYTMFFFGDYGIHGAYWHNNFGHVMSHGCVNMRIIDAKKLFEWADAPKGNQKGTPVSICKTYKAPDQCEVN